MKAHARGDVMAAKARELLTTAPQEAPDQAREAAEMATPRPLPCHCPRCGGQMIVMTIFVPNWALAPRTPPAPIVRLDIL